MSSRDAILGTLRRQLKRGSLQGPQRDALEARLQNPPRSLIPARSQLPQPEQVELFIRMATEASASLQKVADMEAVPAAVAAFILRQNLPDDIVLAPELKALPWSAQTRLRIEQRAARNGDKVTVTTAAAGIAETGTLLLMSGPDSPTTLNFLPDVHIVVLPASCIVGPYEDAWAVCRQREVMPRILNLITGPSRSADIEQTLQLGAHGPVQLHILLVES